MSTPEPMHTRPVTCYFTMHTTQWDTATDRLLAQIGRGIGRCTVLYRDGEPAEIAYWGCIAD
ncbi:hypothetical protein GGE06_002071 [Streptomyces sp. SFB5A]|jgi:hypothetical protein|uniref:Uncharacterized protein n=1 Tax=Streptomyces nymphaeiformis TaxID=2663842 RepID=A0A7W7TXQ1_9ACTN|nr:hypothetical protein [Streptomyces nymphaeiformis]